MTTDEAGANPDTMIGIIFVFGTLARVLFDFGSNRSFVSSAFALHASRELAFLKNKLVVTHLWEKRFFVPRYSRDVKS